MDEEQKKWHEQYTHNLGLREFLRLGIAIIAWILAGIILSNITHFPSVFDGFFITLFVFPFIAPKWKLPYNLFRKIAGNGNLPEEPYPRSRIANSLGDRAWWSYLPSIWWLLVDLILLLAVLGYLSRR